jgi:hypothetical protein
MFVIRERVYVHPVFGYLIYIEFEILEQESSTFPEPDSRKML